MTSLWAGGKCDPCERGRHGKCVGWARTGADFCGCSDGLCRLRLETRVMWDLDDQPNGHAKEEP